MPIDRDELRRHLQDYEDVTGRHVERFVCPITERECDEGELIAGHILNQGIISASRRTVIQYGRVDNFYGTRVEAGFVQFLNLPNMTAAELLARNITLRYADGVELIGFTAGPAAGARFPLSDPICLNGKEIGRVYLRTGMNDGHVRQQPIYVESHTSYTPSHITAAMVKAAYLCLFSLLGYRAVRSVFGEVVRQPLHAFFQDEARREDAYTYFYPFRNAVKPVISSKTGNIEDGGPETLNDDTYIFHFTPTDLIFAVSLRFKMNGVVVMVTLPMTATNVADRDEEVMRTYNHLMEDESSVAQYIRWVKVGREGYAYLSDKKEMTYGAAKRRR